MHRYLQKGDGIDELKIFFSLEFHVEALNKKQKEKNRANILRLFFILRCKVFFYLPLKGIIEANFLTNCSAEIQIVEH